MTQKEVDELKSKMKKYKIKQKEIAKILSVSVSTIANITNGTGASRDMCNRVVDLVDVIASAKEAKLQKAKEKYKDDNVFKDYIIKHQYLEIETIADNCGRKPKEVMPLYNEYLDERYGRLNNGSCV